MDDEEIEEIKKQIEDEKAAEEPDEPEMDQQQEPEQPDQEEDQGNTHTINLKVAK